MILLIDNYDSFVHNLARYLRRLGQETLVVRNDRLTLRDISDCEPDAIVFSPGPCAPQQAGICLQVVRELHTSVPMLGVCLGHQVIAEAFGANIVRSPKPIHGHASLISHDGSGTFEDLPAVFRVGRYHSLVVGEATVPECLRVNAKLEDGTIMALEHRSYPVVGWQFHPESVLTEHGYQLLQAFLLIAGLTPQADVSGPSNELRRAIPVQPDWFQRAVGYPGT